VHGVSIALTCLC